MYEPIPVVDADTCFIVAHEMSGTYVPKWMKRLATDQPVIHEWLERSVKKSSPKVCAEILTCAIVVYHMIVAQKEKEDLEKDFSE
jgi:hypothetical protein